MVSRQPRLTGGLYARLARLQFETGAAAPPSAKAAE
jgi:hypothetical protein